MVVVVVVVVEVVVVVNEEVGNVAGGEHCKPTADSRMEAEGASGGGFRQSEMESEIATAYNHALAIPLQLAQLNLQSPPTGAGCYFENSITGESSG